MNFVAPGAYWREFDYSQYVARLSTCIVGIVGCAEWGPMNTPTLITNEGQMTRKFGAPVPDDMALYAVRQYLNRGRQVRFVRVGSSAETTKATKSSVYLHNTSNEQVILVEALYEGAIGDYFTFCIAGAGTTGRYNVVLKGPLDNKVTNIMPIDRWDGVCLDDPNDDRYIETLINAGSKTKAASRQIRVTVLDPMTAPVTGEYALTGGNSGKMGVSSADYIGTIYGNQRTGIQCFGNREMIDINILAVPGVSDEGVIRAGIDMCEKVRCDCVYYVDPPMGLDTEGVVDWHNGNSALSDGAFNSSFAALFWPWIEIDDPYSGDEIWTPPSGFAMEASAYTDDVAEPWFAIAGFNRGRVNANRAEYEPDLGEREYMYSGGNAVNCIATFQKDGLVIYGQRTLQRQASALDRLDVRRGLCQLEKQIATAVKYLTFEPNDPILWRQFRSLVKGPLDYMKKRRGLREYQVICDDSTNEAYTYDQNTMIGKILLKPVKAAEIIVVDYCLLSSGASFAEALEYAA